MREEYNDCGGKRADDDENRQALLLSSTSPYHIEQERDTV